MSVFLAKRFVTFVATLFGASLVVFLALEILPGDPAMTILGPDADPEAYEALRRQLGLNEPALTRYVGWMGGLMVGDLGTSYAYSVPVGELIFERLYITVPLALMAMALTVAAALALGIFAAARHRRAGDYGVILFSQLGIAVPQFWFGILLILFFAVYLGWFSSGGFSPWEEGFWAAIKSLLLPAVALATVQAAILTRVTRSSVLETFREDYVRTARAKGLSRRATLWRHVLRNAMIPVITIMGLQFANLLAGTIIVENVFFLPGLGRLVFQAIANRDLVVVKDVVLFLAAMVVAVNFLVDLAYAVIDPRLKVHDV
ncbi:MAG TPA: ABC transporter permease [Alphaproteobacteria bacterium]|jgi:peptide/nickel transport system permease protein|nr:ABC transporter permease [Alphaproteobacteria bacterium]HJM50840.1 ABC transporter permease [Alphaproteobacteria bacterium]|tara:strand:- start:432 stop:1382 length:951 start_codon:yes stop_codon:yes gene_type:complete